MRRVTPIVITGNYPRQVIFKHFAMTFCKKLKINFLQTKLCSATKPLSISPDILADVTVEFGGGKNPHAVTDSASDNTKVSISYAASARKSIWSPSYAESTVTGVVGGIPHAGLEDVLHDKLLQKNGARLLIRTWNFSREFLQEMFTRK
jgi:hypothetical protein